MQGVCRNWIQNCVFLKMVNFLCSKEGCVFYGDKSNNLSQGFKGQEENGLKHPTEVTDVEHSSNEFPRNVFFFSMPAVW